MEFKKRNHHILTINSNLPNPPKKQNENYTILEEESKIMKSTFFGKEFEKGHFNAYLKKIEEEII